MVEEFPGGTLADLPLDVSDQTAIEELVRELGQAVHSLAEAGLRHRDLRPSTIFVRSRDPLDLVIGGFGSARLSEFDLDIASPLETTRYMAPEAIAGGVAPASDWWSLGMILLERITGGACFEGVNEQAFLIHVLTNGVPLPENLDPSIDLLLRGLLARDRRQRWQWKEVQAWLAGEAVSAPEGPRPTDAEGRAAIALGGKQYRSAGSFALAAAEAANWDEAKSLLLRGAVATWASEAGFEAKIPAALRQFVRVEELTDDLRLSIALKTLNPAMPLIVRGNIVTPGWLLDHPDDGYSLITGPAPDLLRKVDPDDWLWRLKVRAETVRKRLHQLEIAVDEDVLRVHLLSTSMARLAALWEEKRKLLPDTDHAGVVSLVERRQSAEEDLVILLSASPSQFRSVQEVVEDAAKEAAAAGLSGFSHEAAATRLARPRREIYQAVDERIQNFARCGISSVDEWADEFRLDRRMPIGRALALLSVPTDAWKPLPKQGYVSTILDFFAKRISGGVLRGPLTRMLIGKSARIDLTELDTSRLPATEILDHLLARAGRAVNIDPAAFSENEGLERRLRSLHSHALLYKRDTGIDGLYMGFPFLLMRDGKPNTKPRIAPVLLWPVSVIAGGRKPRSRYDRIRTREERRVRSRTRHRQSGPRRHGGNSRSEAMAGSGRRVAYPRHSFRPGRDGRIRPTRDADGKRIGAPSRQGRQGRFARTTNRSCRSVVPSRVHGAGGHEGPRAAARSAADGNRARGGAAPRRPEIGRSPHRPPCGRSIATSRPTAIPRRRRR